MVIMEPHNIMDFMPVYLVVCSSFYLSETYVAKKLSFIEGEESLNTGADSTGTDR